jgi:hypothetical protein
MEENSQSGGARDHVPEQRQVLRDQSGSLDSRDIAAWSGQTHGKAHGHEISCSRGDDRDRAGHLLHAGSLDATLDDEEVRARSDQLSGQFRDSVILLTVGAVLGDEVSSVDPSKLPHSLVEGPLIRKVRREHAKQETNPVDLPRLLGLSGERRGEHGNTHRAEKGSPVHARRVLAHCAGGMVRQD